MPREPRDARPEGVATLGVNGVLVEHWPGRQVVIGRGASVDVPVDHPLVSRRHVLAEAVEGGWVVTDLGSRNGMFVAGERVVEARLPATGPVRLGSPMDGPVVELVAAPRPPSGGGGGVGPVGAGLRGAPVVGRAPDPECGEDADRGLGQVRTVYEVRAERLRIGRAPDNEIVLADDLRASRHHAELACSRDGTSALVDLGSHNGTFVNGSRIRRTTLGDGDLVSIGNHIFRFAAGALVEYEEAGASLEVVGLSAWSEDGLRLFDDVSFSLPPANMLAVVGPSGVGKSSLLNALTGFKPAGEGAVFFGGRDLYASYDELRSRMGYVPQEDIVHPQLRVREALTFAAELRFGADVAREEREARVEEVIAELGLSGRADVPIERLSGGQRKRVSVGIELLTKPALLVLDEPTSGLDPGNEEQVMRLLRDLADGGRIVVVVTHSAQSLDVADRLLFLAPGGRTAYYGPPSARSAYFERHGCSGSDAAVFRALAEDDAGLWQERFRRDPLHEEHVGRPLARASTERSVAVRAALPPRAELPWRRQVSVLVRRQLSLFRSDRRTLVMLAVQAPMFGLIDVLLFPVGSISTGRGPFAALLVWLMVIGVTWLSTSNTVREIVKEHAIYRRERSVGLSTGAYVTSKVVVFGCVALVQTLLLFFVAMSRQQLPPADPDHIMANLQQAVPQVFGGLSSFARGAVMSSPLLELLVDVALASLAATALGLFVSAMVRRSDQALVVLPIVLVVQIALSMPLLAMQNPSQLLRILGFFSSAQWGTAAGATTVSLNQLLTSYQLSLTAGGASLSFLLGHPLSRPFVRLQVMRAVNGYGQWSHATDPWVVAVTMLVVLTAAGVAGTWIVLRRRDASLLASPVARPGLSQQGGRGRRRTRSRSASRGTT